MGWSGDVKQHFNGWPSYCQCLIINSGQPRDSSYHGDNADDNFGKNNTYFNIFVQ